MKKIFLIFKREYLQEVRTKWFKIIAILPAVGIVILWGVVTLIGEEGLTFKKKKIAVLDNSGIIIETLTAREDYMFVTLEDTSAINEKVLRGELAGYLLIENDVLESGKIHFYTTNVGDISEINKIRRILNTVVIDERLARSDIDIEKLKKIRSRVYLKVMRVTKAGEEEESGLSYGVGFGIMFILYMVLIMSASLVARSIIEEKTNRVIEVLVSTIKPFQLMIGKLLGIGGVMFTQIGIWVATLIPFLLYGKLMLQSVDLPEISIPIGIISYCLIAFVLGFFLFASLMTAFASTASTEREANQAQMIPVMLIVIMFFITQFWIIKAPDNLVSTVLSLFPFFTPLMMPVRITVGSPPMWQIGLSIILVLGAIFLMTWVSSKIYRIGILMYGKKPSLTEIFKWLRYS